MSEEPRIFASIGRSSPSGERRSAVVLAIAGVGLALAFVAFLVEEGRRHWVHTVEVAALPEEAAAAEAELKAKLQAAEAAAQTEAAPEGAAR